MGIQADVPLADIAQGSQSQEVASSSSSAAGDIDNQEPSVDVATQLFAARLQTFNFGMADSPGNPGARRPFTAAPGGVPAGAPVAAAGEDVERGASVGVSGSPNSESVGDVLARL